MRWLFHIVVMLVWIGAGPAQARSDTPGGVFATSNHFALYADAPVEARAILSDLEAFRAAVLADLDIIPPAGEAPLTLTITDDMDAFRAVSPGGITAAVYLQSVAGDDIVVGYDRDPDGLLGDALEPDWLRLVLRHEVVHHLIETHYPRKLPLWLGEGLAEYYATFDPDADGLAVFGRVLPEQERLPESGPWLPMRTVVESMARYPDYTAASPGPSGNANESLFRAQRLYYGQASALAHFVMDQPEGLARLHRFVDGLHEAGDSEDSFEAAFGLRYADLERRMRASIANGNQALRVRRVAPQPPRRFSVKPLSRDAGAANRLRLLLAHGHVRASVDALVSRARLEAEPSADTSPVLLAGSLHAWRRKDWDASDRLARRVLVRDPNNAAALKLRAKTAYGRVSQDQTDDALWSAAEEAALRALAADPDDAEMHLFRVAVSLPESDRLRPEALASLDWLKTRQAHLRLPHDAMMMIPALIYERRYSEADAVLDNAARWTDDPADRFVIDRLRDSVATDRMAAGDDRN